MPNCFVVGVEVSLASWANGSLNIGMGKVDGVMNGRNMQAEGLCGLELGKAVWTLASGGGEGERAQCHVSWKLGFETVRACLGQQLLLVAADKLPRVS